MADKPLYFNLSFVMHKLPCSVRGELMPDVPVRLHAARDLCHLTGLSQKFPGVHVTMHLSPCFIDALIAQTKNHTADNYERLARVTTKSISGETRKSIINEILIKFLTDDPVHNRDNNYREIQVQYPNKVARIVDIPDNSMLGVEARGRQALKYLSERDQENMVASKLQLLFPLLWFSKYSIKEDGELRHLLHKHNMDKETADTLFSRLDHHVVSALGALKSLQKDGIIDTTTMPYYAPALPLLCNTDAAKVNMYWLKDQPSLFSSPEDAEWQVKQGMSFYKKFFGKAASGMWSPGAGISEEVVKLLASSGVQWTIGTEEMLQRSLSVMQRSPHRLKPEEVYSPWRVRIGDNDMAMVIRDNELSNLVSFEYPRWEDSKAAARDLIDRLKGIREAFQTLPGQPPLVNVVLNGIGTWANYPDGGYTFLEELYRSLEGNNHGIKTASVPEYLKYLTKQGTSWSDLPVTEYMNRYDITGTNLLTEISPTAWHNGNFDPWIGKRWNDKAWTYLTSVRRVMTEKDPGHENNALWEEMYGLEAGDYLVELGKEQAWGDEHNTTVNSFRGRLRDLYRRLDTPMPNDPFFELRPLA